MILAVACLGIFGVYPLGLPHGKPGDIRCATVEGARRQLAIPASYDAAYVTLGYPEGDVKYDRGACTDVVIRALRWAGYDLQKLVYDDAKRGPQNYRLGANGPNWSIDHRRAKNLAIFFRRHGQSLAIGTTGPSRLTWRPGDIVHWRMPTGRDHVGVLSELRGASGLPMVIHNMQLTREEDVLSEWTIIGHFRYP